VTTNAAHRAGTVCLDVHSQAATIATGGADGSVVVRDASESLGTAKISASFSASSAAITTVKLHPSRPLVLTSSADGAARVHRLADGGGAPDEMLTLRAHAGGVSGCSLHTTGDYLATASADASWALFDLHNGACLVHAVAAEGDASGGYRCVGFHPDGLILATGMGAVVKVWDVKSQSSLAAFEGHGAALTCLAFSENGYYLATGAADATVKLWDLRKLKNFHTIEPPAGAASPPVRAVCFDFSAQVLAYAADGICLVDTKAWAPVATFPQSGAAAAPTAVGFGPGGTFVAAASADGVVQLYGA